MSSPHLVVIGAGPGGYTAAFRATDLGLRVTLIDTDARLGGTCLNWGCIPSKALLHAAELITDAAEAATLGITLGPARVDIEKLRAWKDAIVSKLTGGLAQLAKARGVTVIQGRARFLSPVSLEIIDASGNSTTLQIDQAIIATGSRPVELPLLPRSARVWDSTDALTLPRIPSSLLVVGGGYIGLELGTAYAALGSQVTVADTLPALLPAADKDLADIVIRSLRKKFKAILCGVKIAAAAETPEGLAITFIDAKDAQRQETFDQVLVCAGRQPSLDGLGIEAAGIKVNDDGRIEVDIHRRTTVRTLFAIGDVTRGPMLAHKASAEAKVAADAAAGYGTGFSPKTIPGVIYTDPELAWCGMTEAEARGRCIDIIVSKFPWAASGRAMTMGHTDGMTKIIADTQTGRLLGIGIVGRGAGELIAEGALAIAADMKAEDLELTIHPHPTLSEMLMEGAEGLFGHTTHLFKKK